MGAGPDWSRKPCQEAVAVIQPLAHLQELKMIQGPPIHSQSDYSFRNKDGYVVKVLIKSQES